MNLKQTFHAMGRSGWLLIAAAFVIGFLLRGGCGNGTPSAHDHSVAPAAAEEVWTCSMHPQIRQPGPGQCPICGMDLIPVSDDGGGDDGPRRLTLSETARKLAQIQVAPVERKFVAADVRMSGKIEVDETRVRTISAYVPGRIDRLYVNYTGVTVRDGDHLVELYSPELIAAQEELLQALRSERSRPALAGGGSMVAAVRQKLRLWGLTETQIAAIERRGEPARQLTIYSPIGGIVLERLANEGSYVNTGTPIYTIADLSHLWVLLDAYESDLQWIRFGQEVTFQVKAYPGETFSGRISFIDPLIDPRTRTVKVRVNVANSDGKLKPDMFVTAEVQSRLTVAGRAMDPALAGKWISPMHPEVVKDGPGACDVCGMELVPAEELGFVTSAAGDGNAPLVIPASAPLLTGKRAIVYVAVDREGGVYEGREVTLGPRAGEHYLVADGLKEGEWVVTHGSFKLDSDLQIRGRPSMMSPPAAGAAAGHGPGDGHDHGGMDMSAEVPDFSAPEPFRQSLDALLTPYFEMHAALSGDSLAAARPAAEKVAARLGEVDMTLLDGEAQKYWMERLAPMREAAGAIAAATAMDDARSAFETLSNHLTLAVRAFGTTGKQPVLQFYCPMAFDDRGAFWLQSREGVENPYFGSMMYRCGEQRAVLVGEARP